MKKVKLIKQFDGLKKDGMIFIHENQTEYFVDKGLIEGKTKKTKKVDKSENVSNEN